MAEYALFCDICGKPVNPDDGLVGWITRGDQERDHRLVHLGCNPAEVTDGVELRLLISPSGFLTFITDRLAHQIGDPKAVAGIVWALAPFISRHDTGTEMQVLRAATFGMIFGVKPGEIRRHSRLPTALTESSDSKGR